MSRILWIAPNLNHYKAKVLNCLAQNGRIDLAVLSGATPITKGHRSLDEDFLFTKVTLTARKASFHFHPGVYAKLFTILSSRKVDIVVMPLEKKHVLIIFFLFVLRFLFKYNLVSYNHPLVRSKNRSNPVFEKLYTKLLFRLYDKIIFYTKQGHSWALKQGLLTQNKAFFANNTLDTEEIWRHYNFEVNRSDTKTILFIGRLIANKRLDLLLKYYTELKNGLPGMRLIIIGDGPEAHKVKSAVEKDQLISWKGAIVDEEVISRYMRRAHLVLVPGWSGLSIIHAFAYRKPYATIQGSHPPEIVYLKDGENGLILTGNITKDCKRITGFLSDTVLYEAACRSAFVKAKELSIENWCRQIRYALSA